MSINCEMEKALSNLLFQNEVDNLANVIDEMFEGWICSHMPDGLDVEKRSNIYFAYRELREFLLKIKDAEN